MNAFAETSIVPDFTSGAVSVAQSHGIGALESNTVLMGWSGTPAGRAKLLGLLREMAELDKSALFLNVDDAVGFGRQRVVNVWWGGRGGNADLMLLLGYLVSRNRDWDNAELRLTRVVESLEGEAQIRAHMADLLEEVRVEARVEIVVKRPGQSITDLFATHSRDVDLTILGLQVPAAEEVEAYGERVEAFSQAVGTVLLVYNASYEEEML
jgi:hypothetical protein